MKTGMKIAIGVGVLAAAAGIAMAAGGAGGSGVTVVGDCEDFRIDDWDAWIATSQESWKESWEGGVRDPDTMIINAWKAAVPDCEWPPKEGTAARQRWDNNIEQIRSFVQQLIDQLEAAEEGSIQMTTQGAGSIASQAARRIGSIFVTIATVEI